MACSSLLGVVVLLALWAQCVCVQLHLGSSRYNEITYTRNVQHSQQSWSQKKSTCTCDEVRANPQGILLFWGEPLVRQSNPWLGHKRGHKQVRRPTCSVAQYWIHRIGLLLMIEFYRILEVWMDTFWGKRRHLYLSFEKDTAGDAWEWDYFMPPTDIFRRSWFGLSDERASK